MTNRGVGKLKGMKRRGDLGTQSAPGSRTALQKHVDFFDADGNSRITLAETYGGFRRLGFGCSRSALFAGVIHLALGPTTSGFPTLTIDSRRIHLGKHSSDTGIFDSLGHFQAASFNRRFNESDEDRDGALTATELSRLLARRRTDWIGHMASWAEFSLLFGLAGETRGTEKVLTRERLASFYDGSLLHQLAANTAKSQTSPRRRPRVARQPALRKQRTPLSENA